VREQVPQREAVAHLGVQVEQALLERDHAGNSDERLGQRREREQRVGPDRLVAAALAHASAPLREHARGIDDDRCNARDEALRHPVVDRCERRLHGGHRSGWRRFRDICQARPWEVPILLIQWSLESRIKWYEERQWLQPA
jgi:hypothetical protein